MNADASALTSPLLAGWRVALLRNERAQSPLTRAIVRAGAEVVALPTLSVRGAADPDALRSELRRLETATAWVFVSPAAVRFAWRAWSGFVVAGGAAVFAVGPGTAAALARRGVAAQFPPQRHDSEGLLAMPELAAVRGTVALVKAPGGRELIAHGLRTRGIEVCEVAAYRRAPLRWDRRHRARLAALLEQPHALLVDTSREALDALAKVAGASFDEVLGLPLVVSSERLAAHANAMGFPTVHVAGGSTAAALLAGAIEIVRLPNRVAGSNHRISRR